MILLGLLCLLLVGVIALTHHCACPYPECAYCTGRGDLERAEQRRLQDDYWRDR